MVNQINEVWGRNGGNASGDAFDLLELGGADLRPLPLVDGKAMLGKLIAPPAGEIELSEHPEGTVLYHAYKLGCEGIVEAACLAL
jgi:ATP-dependent DNA ligase